MYIASFLVQKDVRFYLPANYTWIILQWWFKLPNYFVIIKSALYIPAEDSNELGEEIHRKGTAPH